MAWMADMKTRWVISALGENILQLLCFYVWNKQEVSWVLLWEGLAHPVLFRGPWLNTVSSFWVQNRLLVGKAAAEVLQLEYCDHVWIHYSIQLPVTFLLSGRYDCGHLSPGLLQEFGRQCLCLWDIAFHQSQWKRILENAERRGREHSAFPGEFHSAPHN